MSPYRRSSLMSSGLEVKTCCKIIRQSMAIIYLKTAIFRGILTYFWHFYRLRSYLCSKWGVLGFHNQATPRRPSDEPFFTLGSTVHDWGWPKTWVKVPSPFESKILKTLVVVAIFKHSLKKTSTLFFCKSSAQSWPPPSSRHCQVSQSNWPEEGEKGKHPPYIKTSRGNLTLMGKFRM